MKNVSKSYIKFILALNILLIFSSNAAPKIIRDIKDTATTINLLKRYKAINPSFNIDPNFAFIVDNQNPTIKIYYKNDKGQTKYRIYRASIDSIGLKFSLAINLNLVFFTGNLDFVNTKKVLKIKNGFSINPNFFHGVIFKFLMHNPLLYKICKLFFLEVIYCSLENAPGGLIIITYPVGVHASILSYINGGTLIPHA